MYFNMMMWSNVTEAELESKKEIPTEFGETLTEDLQNEIGNKKTGQVFFIPSPDIKQRKIENDNIDPLFPCQYTPLNLYFIIITSKTVDRLDHHDVTGLQLSYQCPITGAVEILIKNHLQRGGSKYKFYRLMPAEKVSQMQKEDRPNGGCS